MDLWYGSSDGMSLFGNEWFWSLYNGFVNFILNIQEWWVKTVSSGSLWMQNTAQNFNKSAFTSFINLPILDSIITISITFGVVFIFIKYGFAVFKYYAVQLDDGVSPLTIDFIKKVVVSLLFCFFSPYIIISGFNLAIITADAFIYQMKENEIPKTVNVIKDIQDNHLSLGSYCYEGIKEDKEQGNSNIVQDNKVEGTYEFKTSNAKTLQDSKLKIKGSFITLFPEDNENNTGKTMTTLYNTYCKTQPIYDGYQKDEEGNDIQDEQGNSKKLVVENSDGEAETFQPLRVIQTINNNPDLYSQMPTSIMGLVAMVCALFFCAITAFNVAVRLAEFMVLIIMTPFYGMKYLDVGQSNAMQIWTQEYTSIILSHGVSMIIFAVFMTTCINSRTVFTMIFGLALLLVQMKGPSALRAWSHNTGVSQIGSKVASGVKNALKKK